MQANSQDETSKRIEVREILGLLAFVFLLWLSSSAVLWRAYSFGILCESGAFDHHTAIGWVTKFGGIMTTLLAGVCVLRRSRLKPSRLRSAFTVLWQSATILFLYATVIFIRRETWSMARGESDWAMFFGTLNARFFSEVGPIIFVLHVLPVIAIVSALIFYAHCMLFTRKSASHAA